MPEAISPAGAGARPGMLGLLGSGDRDGRCRRRASPRLRARQARLSLPPDRAGARLAFPGDLPERGALVATGNALSPKASRIVVDLDAGTIRWATTRLSATPGADEPASVIERDTSRELTTSETDAVVRAANALWAMKDPASIDAPWPTDALCSVALSDGNEVLHEFGAACQRASFVETLTGMAVIPQ